MPVLRQLTVCSAPATHVVEARSRKKGRVLKYRVEMCASHRWLARPWPGRRASQEPDGRCGTMADHRAYTQVVQSHVEAWIGPLTGQDLQAHDGDVSAALRAAHRWLQDGSCSEIWHAVAALLGHAAWLAEAVASGMVEVEAGERQVLAALSAAETIDGTARGV
ncbi:hypothetical protein AB0D98_19675 [Streptomyces sp. NPDC047987]|uniref:hypothetical protein n=1 Tax=unclassified Streptomyces TaxID=2593676 RepID=UPI00342BD651